MALVYSYIRFSSKKQEHGDSFRRQTKLADKWIAKNNHTLADSFLDPGVSAYRGKHTHKKALSRFLAFVEEGTIKKGSILLIESLDRLSREGVYDAYALFLQILNSGIKIAVLRPFEMVYDRRKSDDFISILMPIISFYLAHLESKQKSDRVGSAWEDKRALASKTKPISRRRPSWLDWDGEKFVINKAAAEAVRYIYQACIDGAGGRVILEGLNKRYKPIGRSKKWNGSFIQKVLNDRAVIGEWQPHSFTEEGQRVPVGKVIKDYYPAIIDEGTFFRAQQSKAQRYKQRSPSEGFINLFAGLTYCAVDGQKMHLTRSRATRSNGETYTQRRLASYGHNRKLTGACNITFDYHSFETYLLWLLWEVDPADLKPSRVGPTKNKIESKERELEAVKGRIRDIRAVLVDVESKEPLQTTFDALSELGALETQLSEELDALNAEAHSSDVGADEYKTLIHHLAEAEGEDFQAIRLKLRSIIARLIDRIDCTPERANNRRVTVTATVTYKSGRKKTITFDRDKLLRVDELAYHAPYLELEAMPFAKLKAMVERIKDQPE